jgi:hypothetical protein
MRPAVATYIVGGLGNQMFQYAIARRLARRTRAELLQLVHQRSDVGGGRVYGLTEFTIAGREINDEAAIPRGTATSRLHRALFPRRAPEAAAPRIVRERNIWDYIGKTGPAPPEGLDTLLFEPAVLTLRGTVLLQGFWQDERYFADIAATIRRDFRLRTALDARNRDALARIRRGPSAFLHVRRGDYLSPEHVHRYGVCEPDYYQRALDTLRARVGPGVRIFVFSNDPDWVRRLAIGGAEAEIIDWNASRPAYDLTLMRACDHAIIANSSFSWWGAWLGDRPGRTVIAPRVWLKAVPAYRDIVPARWLRL